MNGRGYTVDAVVMRSTRLNCLKVSSSKITVERVLVMPPSMLIKSECLLSALGLSSSWGWLLQLSTSTWFVFWAHRVGFVPYTLCDQNNACHKTICFCNYISTFNGASRILTGQKGHSIEKAQAFSSLLPYSFKICSTMNECLIWEQLFQGSHDVEKQQSK